VAEIHRQPPEQPMTPSDQIDAYIAGLADFRGETIATVRRLILEADPQIVEEWKWMGSPVWERDGLIAVADAHKGKVKVTIAYGAFVPDPSGLFNNGLEGNQRRAIDLYEGDKLDEAAFKAVIRAAVAYNQARVAERKAKKKK
jgi:hypothetical protein